MSIYPGAIDGFRTVQNLPGIFYDETDATTVYAEDCNNSNSAVVAIETELGTNPSGAAPSVASRLDGIDATLAGKENSIGYTPENASNKSTSTALGTSNTLYPTQNAVKTYIDAAIIAAKSAMMPVGTIYGNSTVSTNPGTLLGFGTWVEYSEGRTVVGKAASGTFGTAGATMGAETHTLTALEIASHTHATIGPTVGFDGNVVAGGSGGTIANLRNDSTAWRYYSNPVTGSAGGGQPHNNIQPSKVAYLWERTA